MYDAFFGFKQSPFNMSPDPAFLYNQDLRPQTSATLKAGIKGSWTKKNQVLFFKALHFDASFFTTSIDNEIVQYEIYGDNYYRNASKTNRLGFAVHGKLEVYRDLVFSIAYTYSHYIYKSYTAKSLETDSTGTLVQVTRDFSGNAEPNVPRNNLNLSLSYKHPMGKKIGIFARLSYLGISGVWVDDANSAKTDSYNLVNTLLGLNMKFGHFVFTLSGGVNNIFNRVYAGDSNLNSADKRFYDAGSPRDFTGAVNFGYSF